ncbi:MAG: hypothetical protein K2V38_17125, partial [Gemmataceae bacterium]|nr:hypothetical protein [Gemmataceae bacterium]
MFWRGAIPIPLSSSTAAAAAPFRWVADHTIQNQAKRLEVWELNADEGEAELTGSALRLTLTGSRGVAVTALWLSAIEKQKRNDFHEFEQRVQMVTKLQPNFITPWIFQSWNIAYNVSVEMHGSGDMYFYIVRGIQLLAEGERRNKRSPDMRYQIAFYYQNKFGVSDQVDVLRCLFDLSCIPPSDRDPKDFYAVTPQGERQFDLKRFEAFCERHPHLVRRLKGEDQRYTDKRVEEKLRRATPQEVVQFLADNRTVPSRYRTNARAELTDDLADPENQFPVLPGRFSEADEAHPLLPTPDDGTKGAGYFSAFKAARAWFSYSLLLLPPPIKDDQGVPVAGPTTQPGTFGHNPGAPDFHRVPRLPMLIIFRQGAPRAQSYAAELEQKEGWFDREGWLVDDPKNQPANWWFPDETAQQPRPRGVVLAAGRDWSLEEWRRSAELWDRHGKDNGLDPARLPELEKRVGDRSNLPADPTPEQLIREPELRERYLARLGIDFFRSNRQVTNFPFFLASAQAESQPQTVQARKTLWQAEQARKVGDPQLAIQLYKRGLEQWKDVLGKRENAGFLRTDRVEEETFEFEIAYQRLLVLSDPRVREYANKLTLAAPFLGAPFPADDAWHQAQLKAREKQWEEDMKRWEERQAKKEDKLGPPPPPPRSEPDTGGVG